MLKKWMYEETWQKIPLETSDKSKKKCKFNHLKSQKKNVNLTIAPLTSCSVLFATWLRIHQGNFLCGIQIWPSFWHGGRNSVLIGYGNTDWAVKPPDWTMWTQIFPQALHFFRGFRIWPPFWHGGTEFRTFRVRKHRLSRKTTRLNDVDPNFYKSTPFFP